MTAPATRNRRARAFSREIVKDGRFHEGMVTIVTGISYDPVTRTGRVDQPRACCTDMTGAIELFRRIDAGVERIEAYAGGQLDVCYVKDGDAWEALCYRRGEPFLRNRVTLAPRHQHRARSAASEAFALVQKAVVRPDLSAHERDVLVAIARPKRKPYLVGGMTARSLVARGYLVKDLEKDAVQLVHPARWPRVAGS